ncbi:MAG TPA: HAD domain-containing protein [Anaeromyxobacteraceae bacterium]|nr:HAD domain-containing protein [Anaeromyxobacteraceae bacterium]
MKVVFLDIDGVLNSERFFAEAQPARWGIGHIDPGAVGRVQELARRTGAKIVISSAWRHAYPVADLRVILRVAGLEAPIVGATPDLDDGGAEGRVRAAEITAWLEGNALRAEHGRAEPVEAYVVLDDLEDFGPLEPRVVRTRFADGLLDEHVERAVALLGAEGRDVAEVTRAATAWARGVAR